MTGLSVIVSGSLRDTCLYNSWPGCSKPLYNLIAPVHHVMIIISCCFEQGFAASNDWQSSQFCSVYLRHSLTTLTWLHQWAGEKNRIEVSGRNNIHQHNGFMLIFNLKYTGIFVENVSVVFAWYFCFQISCRIYPHKWETDGWMDGWMFYLW